MTFDKRLGSSGVDLNLCRDWLEHVVIVVAALLEREREKRGEKK